MNEHEWLVQEAWLRLSRQDAAAIDNLGGWLTTVVARICLNELKARRSRREEPVGVHVPDPVVSHESGVDPEQEALLADSILRADARPHGLVRAAAAPARSGARMTDPFKISPRPLRSFAACSPTARQACRSSTPGKTSCARGALTPPVGWCTALAWLARFPLPPACRVDRPGWRSSR